MLRVIQTDVPPRARSSQQWPFELNVRLTEDFAVPTSKVSQKRSFSLVAGLQHQFQAVATRARTILENRFAAPLNLGEITKQWMSLGHANQRNELDDGRGISDPRRSRGIPTRLYRTTRLLESQRGQHSRRAPGRR